jgi:TonB family protein
MSPMLALVCAAWAGGDAAPTVPPGAEAPGATPDTAEPPPLVAAPEVLSFVQAEYPPEARAAGREASVLLGIEIDAAGRVVDVQVLAPAGDGFDAAAVDAARRMVFSPARDASGPVPVVIEFAYGFKLDAPPPPDSSAASAVEEAPVTLDGQLLEMGTRRPLSSFPVSVEAADAPGEPVASRTDGAGRFAFRGLPPGRWRVRAAQPGWDAVAQIVTVVPGEVTSAKLWVRNQAYGDAGIVGVYAVPTADVSRRTISMEEVRRVPGTFGDPVRVVQNLPGAARAPFGTGLLVIRGSNPEDSGVYVDGIRIPYVYHLGGFASVINPDLVAAVDYLPGGFGPRYGRSMGGVIDVTTQSTFPERTRVAWNTDLLDSGAVVAGSFGTEHQHGFGIAARRSYIDALLPVLLGDDGFTVKPRWYDYQAKYAYQGKAPWKASALLFGFDDVLTASSPEGFAQGSDPSAQGDLGTHYSTHRLVLDASVPLGEDWSLRLTPAFGRDSTDVLLGDQLRLVQGQWLAEVRAEAAWQPSDALRVVQGVDFIGGRADFDILLPFNPEDLASFDPLAEREPYGISGVQDGWGPDTYVLAEWRPLRDPDALLVAPGLRGLFLDIPGEARILAADPRLAMKWRTRPGTLLKGSVGLYHQPPQPFQLYRQGAMRADLDAEQALASSVGIEQRLGPAMQLEVEAFHKAMRSLVVNNPGFRTLSDPLFLNEGVGRVYGVEAMLRRERVGNLFGWVSYTLSRSERKDHPDSDWYVFDVDQTHIFVALAGYRLPYDVEVSGKAEYTTGNPTTPYDLGVYDVDQDRYRGFRTGARNSQRLPPYAALSLRADKMFTFRTWQLSLYCDLLNVLRGTNPEFEVYNYDFTERTYIRGLPFLPSPGFEAKFQW